MLLVSDFNRHQKAEVGPICWRLNSSLDLKKVTEQLQLVHSPLECGQSIQLENRDETIDIKKSKRHLLQAVFGEISAPIPTDVQSQDVTVVWSGRNGR